jgi:Tol biopolymer transport system component
MRVSTTEIAFYSDCGGNSDIWTVPAGGGARTQITTDPSSDIFLSWSPDGTEIAFESDRSGNNDIWTITVADGTATQITTDPAWDVHPSWSPDGTTIAFHSERSGNPDIWCIKPDHTSIEPISLGEIKATFR